MASGQNNVSKLESRKCVFLLPGVSLIEGASYMAKDDFLISTMVAEALAFAPDQWTLVFPETWTPFDDRVIELARIRDLARLLAEAADSPRPSKLITAKETKMSSADVCGLVDEDERAIDVRSLPESLAFYTNRRPVKGAAADISLDLLKFGRGVLSDGGRHVHIDLTGGTRPLVWGPHVALPKGLWALRLNFELVNIGTGRKLLFEWGHMSEFNSQELTFERSGHYELDLQAEWTQADLSEMRVLLPTGAFSGEFILRGCMIERV